MSLPTAGSRSRIQRALPHPLLSLTLVVLWMFLINSFSVGGLVMGLLFGLLIPQFCRGFWPDRPAIRSYGKAFGYLLLVIWDIVVANLQVAAIILFRPTPSLRSRWVCVPLTVRSPEAISLFAGTITMTPGTVSCDLSADGRSLLVHCLDADDPEALVREMKSRYEARILEILE